MKIYILILIISNSSGNGGKTSITQEFNSLAQCQYTYKVLSEQIDKASFSYILTGGCFEK